MLTISLLAQKGGTGKTTVARCLAVAFERSGKSAAIIDMDPQASAALWAKRREAEHPEVIPTVLPLLHDTIETSHEAGLDVLIIDTPPKSSDIAIAAAKHSDLVIIPCRTQVEDIETLPATKQILDLAILDLTRRWPPKQLPHFVLLNSVSPNPARTQEAVLKITNNEAAPLPVCPHTLGERVDFGDSSILGLTPQEYMPNGKAAQEIEKVYKHICEIVRKLKSDANGTSKHTGSPRTQAAKH